jgi:hypothetical protein
LKGAEVAPDPRRIADGWQARFVADGARADEAVRLYRELGFEVAADPIAPEHLSPDCGDCRVVIALRFQMIYTRRPQRPGRETEEAADA